MRTMRNKRAHLAQRLKSTVRSSSVGPDACCLRHLEWPPSTTPALRLCCWGLSPAIDCWAFLAGARSREASRLAGRRARRGRRAFGAAREGPTWRRRYSPRGCSHVGDCPLLAWAGCLRDYGAPVARDGRHICDPLHMSNALRIRTGRRGWCDAPDQEQLHQQGGSLLHHHTHFSSPLVRGLNVALHGNCQARGPDTDRRQVDRRQRSCFGECLPYSTSFTL